MSDLLAALRAAIGDRFRIDRELTGGGMSRVFVAEEVALGRTVVLKVLPPEAAATVNADRFRREVQFAARLQHPHIVPVLSTGEDAGTLWYTMPFIDGDTLRGRLAKGPLTLRDALTYWQHMLDALAHAHRAGIVHRDIKPDNVLVSGRNALVTDFGIAKAVASATAGTHASGLTGVGFVVGTPAYMAPEQAAGVDDVDARADLYSAALVAYEMLTGTPAFGGMTPPQTLAAQVQTMPPAPRTVNPQIPGDVEALLMQCLAKDPQQRPASADALCDALDAIVRGVNTPSRESAAARRPAKRRGLLAGVAVAFTIALAVLLLRRDVSAPVDQPRDLIVVASFTYEPKDSSVARALSEALRIDMQQSPRLKVADPQVVRTTLQAMRLEPTAVIGDSIAQALGVRLGAKAYVTGALSSLGTGYVLTARLVSVKDGAEVAALRENAASANDLLAATDRLSKALREQAGESVASLRASPALPVATTASLEALEHYANGVNLLREAKPVSALAEFEAAVAKDSLFASAWSGISTTLSNLQARPGDRLRAAQRAYALREKLPEFERLRIESRYYSARGEIDQEAATYRRMLAIDPQAYAQLNNLGRLMWGLRDYAAAESLLVASSRVQPGAITPVDMLIGVAAETNNKRLLDSLARTFPTGESRKRFVWSRIENERIADAAYPAFSRQVDSAMALEKDADFGGYLLSQRMALWFMQGRLREATTSLEQVVKPLAETLDPALVPGLQLNLAQARARFLDDNRGAMRLVEEADAYYARFPDPQDRAILDRAWARVVAGDPNGGRKLLAELPTLLPRDTTYKRFIEGEIALVENRPADAARAFRATIDAEPFCHLCGLGALGRAYDALGQRDSVLAIYTRLLDSRAINGRLQEDAFERAAALKRTGELLEERKDLKGALARYRAFVDLWQDADAELQPVVREVRERIARIERSRG